MVQQSHCKNVIMAPQETNTCIKPGNSSKNASRHDSLLKNRVYGCFMISLCNGKVPRLARVSLCFPPSFVTASCLWCVKKFHKNKKKLLFCCLLHFSKTTSTNKQLQQFIQPCSLFLLILSSFGHNHLIALCFFAFVFFKSQTVRWAPDPTTLKSTACRISPAVIQTDLQDRLNLGRDVGLLIQLDALLVGPSRALCRDPLQVGQYHTVSLGHCLELVKQKLQQFQQQPVEGSRERGEQKWDPRCIHSPGNLCPLKFLVLFYLADTQGYMRACPCAGWWKKWWTAPCGLKWIAALLFVLNDWLQEKAESEWGRASSWSECCALGIGGSQPLVG